MRGRPLVIGALLVVAACGRDGAPSPTATTTTSTTTSTTTTAPTTTAAPRTPATTAASAPARPRRLLVFSRTTGYRHDAVPAGVQAVKELGQSAGLAVDASEDPAVFNDRNLARYGAVVFLLTTGDVLDGSQEAAVERYVRGGGGYAGVHSASDTEYGWGFYGELVGARFKSHPPGVHNATVVVEDGDHPSTRGLPPRWTRLDEWYNFQSNPRSTVHVLLTVDPSSYPGSTMGSDHPIAWCDRIGPGRTWYTAMGHAPEAYTEAGFRQHLLGGLRYAAGEPSSDSCG